MNQYPEPTKFFDQVAQRSGGDPSKDANLDLMKRYAIGTAPPTAMAPQLPGITATAGWQPGQYRAPPPNVQAHRHYSQVPNLFPVAHQNPNSTWTTASGPPRQRHPVPANMSGFNDIPIDPQLFEPISTAPSLTLQTQQANITPHSLVSRSTFPHPPLSRQQPGVHFPPGFNQVARVTQRRSDSLKVAVDGQDVAADDQDEGQMNEMTDNKPYE